MKRIVLSAFVLATGLIAGAQTPAVSDDTKGFTEIESVQGTLSSPEKLVKLDSMAGYDFNKHFGVFAGLPIYFASVSSTTTGTTTSSSGSSAGLGNFYLGLAFRAPNP